MTTGAQGRVNTALQRQIDRGKSVGKVLVSDSSLAYVKGIAPACDAKKLLLTAYSLVRSDPKLLECEAESVVRAVAEAGKLGLSVDGVLGHAYLVPFKDRRAGVTVATMMIGYRGLVHLAYQADRVQRVWANVVRENDLFEYHEGVAPHLHHAPPKLGEDRGERTGAYSIIHLAGDGPPLVRVMDREDVEARRARSQAWKNKGADSPWGTDPDPMWAKTTLRDVCKIAPGPDLQAAALRDEGYDEGRLSPAAALDLGDAEVVGDAAPAASNEGEKPEAVPLSCGKCGRQDLREDGTCHDCHPEQPE